MLQHNFWAMFGIYIYIYKDINVYIKKVFDV